MKAGRELDALIATKVMGLTTFVDEVDLEGMEHKMLVDDIWSIGWPSCLLS